MRGRLPLFELTEEIGEFGPVTVTVNEVFVFDRDMGERGEEDTPPILEAAVL